MSVKLVEEIFKKYVVKDDKLLSFGFKLLNGAYEYKVEIGDGEFELNVIVCDGAISAKLSDKEFGDEFEQVNFESVGGYVADIKLECEKELVKIRDNCCFKRYFVHDQANHIADYIKSKYEVSPTFLWADDPYSGVFRDNNSKKWFGIIMYIKKDRLIKDAEGFVEVMNLKTDEITQELLKEKGLYPAYHMNKKHWISIMLDNYVTNERAFELIDISYNNIK